ncbi:hypothetical protein FKG96_10090 [Olivibacter sp. LS-1]|uniref:hypothetical protein n=1 Tax=Olivibacter sp. LS-1 TaxID=2592345 RepID=UPI0011EAB7C7|nr:hypothetical protein [Olivibacter sp. LS-1]QEL01144.1 hypothetical protein FKG96_10090 [Olivibacter sp. LS-1]
MYNEKYYHQYCNRYGAICRVSVLERDYNGLPEDKDCLSVPITINYESVSDNKFDRFKSSSAEVRFVGDPTWSMDELYTSDGKKYKVEHRINGLLKWVGWVLPNGFSQQWSGGLFEMVIEAHDGLQTLDQYRFLTPDGEIWTTPMRHTTILRQCLDFIGLELPLHTMVNLEYEGQVQDEDPVYFTWTHPRTYMDTTVEDEDTFNHVYTEYKNNVMSCYDVVMDICRVWGAKLYQKDGAWKFKRVAEDYGTLTGKSWRVYNTNAGQSDTIPYTPEISFPCISDSSKMVMDGALIRMNNAYRWKNVQYKYRYKVNGDDLTPLIPNGYFLPLGDGPVADPSTYVPNGWEKNGTTGLQINKEPAFGGEHPPGALGATIKMSGIVNVSVFGGLYSSDHINQVHINKGDKIFISWWQKTPFYTVGNVNVYTRSVVRIVLRSYKNDDNTQYTDYTLVNTGYQKDKNYLESRWEEAVPNQTRHNFVGVSRTYPGDNNGWAKVLVDIPEAPDDGYLIFNIKGAALRGEEVGRPGMNDTGVTFNVYDSVVNDGVLNWQSMEVYAISNDFYIADVYTGNQVDYGNKNIPKGMVYTHTEDVITIERPEPLNILTADINNPDLIGTMTFNGNGGVKPFIDKWNDIYNPYSTYASLGMIASRDIMRQYRNIWRVVEGDLISDGLDIDSCITFEDRPTERYIVQRGYFNDKDCSLTGATIMQVYDSNDSQLSGTETIQENYGNMDLENRFIN